MKKINFGPTSARGYFDLHVVPAYSRFQSISNLENAIDLAKGLWETAGWLWSDRYPGVNRRDQPAAASAFDADLLRRCPDLEFFRDLADTAKHGGELHRGSVIVVWFELTGETRWVNAAQMWQIGWAAVIAH
jgi:hypothetical protein